MKQYNHRLALNSSELIWLEETANQTDSSSAEIEVALDRRQIGAISSFKCEHRPEVREFHLRLQPLNPSDDCALELWSLDYKKPSFEDEYNLKLVATLEQTLVAV